MASSFLIIFLLLMPAVSAHSQEIYSWIDENGVRHFSDTSPQGTVFDQYDVKVKTPAPRVYDRHRLIHIQDDDGYCGSSRLPSEKEKDPRLKLVNLLFARKTTTARRQQLIMDLDQAKKNNRAGSSDYLKRLDYSIDECDCLLSWMNQELEKLEEVKELIVMEARQAEYRHEEAKRECGDEPPYRGPTDPEAISWVECTNKNMLRRNRLLKEKQEAQQREQDLIKSMEQE